MPEAWDTNIAARLRPDSSVQAYALRCWREGDPIAFTASTLSEVFYGLRKAAASGRPAAAAAQLRWLREQIRAGLVDVLAFDRRAADVAAALRARIPVPPPPARQSKRRSKADGRVAWTLDLQTAATAFVHGYDLSTADAHHALIAAELSALAPRASALVVQSPPRF